MRGLKKKKRKIIEQGDIQIEKLRPKYNVRLKKDSPEIQSHGHDYRFL